MFIDIANSSTTDPGIMNNDFLAVAQGSLLPRAGNNLLPTTGACDIGAVATRFRCGYIINLNLATTTFNDNIHNMLVWKLAELNTNTSRIEITGLNGDLDAAWDIVAKMSCAPTTTGLFIYLNGDSVTTNYNYCQCYNVGGVLLSLYSNFLFAILYNYNPTTSGDLISFGKTIIYPKTGGYRNIFSSYLSGGIGTSIQYNILNSGIWNNTASTITSLVFQAATTCSIDLKIWRRG